MSPVFSPSQVTEHLHRAGSGRLEDVADHIAERESRTLDLLDRAAACGEQDVIQALHEEVVVLNLEVAESVVMRYRNRGVSVEDLVQVACLGLVKAAHGFDRSKSDNFLGYAVPTILGEVKRFFRDNAWAVRPPRRIQELQASISAAVADLTQDLGRAPRAAEIAGALGLDTEDVARALAADGCFNPSSLDRPTGEDESTPLSAMLTDEERGFDRVEAVAALRPLCRDLSDRDRRIVFLRFFHEWTQARIAQELGITQMQVSRLLTRILNQMRETLAGPDGSPQRLASLAS